MEWQADSPVPTHEDHRTESSIRTLASVAATPAYAAFALAAVVLTACGNTAPGGATGTATEQQPDGDASCEPFGPSDRVQSAPVEENAQFPWDRDDPTVADGFDFNRVISGGPPPDGIPPIDEPCFGPIALGDQWLQPQSPVLSLEFQGEARAYPLAIMTQHEIVNDVVAGEPLVVTYCPLCNSGLAFERTVDGKVLDFGTSGRLYQSNLVMYDRQTKSLWIQFTGEAVVGEPWVGTELERISTALVSWQTFKENQPDGWVLGRDTGHDRAYGRNPYPNYEDQGSSFLFEGPTDDRLPPNTRVVGLTASDDSDPVAIVLEHLRREGVVRLDDIGGEPVTVWWAPGKASALDASDIDQGRDVGQTASYRPVDASARALHFSVSDNEPTHFVDEETGSTWNFDGKAIAGDLEGTQLEALPRDDTFWFVWFSFRPETEVLGASALGSGDGA